MRAAGSSAGRAAVAGAAAVAGVGCAAFGCAPPPPPVAALTVVVDRAAVPLGAPLDLRFRFDVAPDLEADLSGEHHVFVHFLDDRGDLLWTEDHEPPIPTSEWRPGQTVEYERRVKIPMYPYIGEAEIAAGLYSVGSVDGGERLPLAGTHLGQFAYSVAAIRLDPQHESSFITYGDGWHSEEFSADGRRQWRWTSGRGVISFRNPNRDARLVLEFDGRPDLFDSPQRLSLGVGERVFRELTIDTNGVVHHVEDVSAADLGTEDVVELELRVEPTFVPAQVRGDSRDTRELGVRVHYLYFEPS